jgi:hypothetical protein
VSTSEGWSGSLTVHVQADQAASEYSRKGWSGSLTVHVQVDQAASEYSRRLVRHLTVHVQADQAASEYSRRVIRQLESTCEGWPGSWTEQMQAGKLARKYWCRPTRLLASTDWLPKQLESRDAGLNCCTTTTTDAG